MPLPKEYYDILKSGDRPLRNQPTTQTPNFGFSPAEPVEDEGTAWGSVGDFLWSAGEGFTSGMTLGLTDLAGATGEEPWEEMTGGEKAGWILGEGASLFAPWGPIGLLGKTSRAIAKAGGNKFIQKSAKEATEGMVLNKAQSKAILEASKKGVKFEDDVAKALNKTAQDDLGITWIKDLNATGKAALDASENLTLSGARAVQKAFKDAGMPDIDVNDAAKISGEFVESLKGGRYVNDIAEWATRGLTGRIPDTANNFVAKYLGMMAQDMMLLSLHGLGSGKIRSLANNEDFDLTGALGHEVKMALAFPLIRKIPNIAGMGAGGMSTASQGVKAYMNQFKSTNYKAIQEAHGDEVVKNILKVMVRGSKKDLLSRSKLADASWKAGNKTYKNGDEVLKALPDMKIDDTITILNKMNKAVNQNIMKAWGPKWLEDTIGSVPRMGLGVLAMNPWVVSKDAWGSMESPEIASHLFMAAVMTRGRGEWGYDQQRAHFADFTPYHEALNVLGVDTKNVQDVLRFHDGKNIHEGLGVAMSTHEAGNSIVEIFDSAVQGAEFTANSRDYSNPDHALVLEMSSLYNIIKKTGDPDFSPIRAQNLDRSTLNTLAEKLSNVKFEDGTTVKDIGFEGALVKLTLEPAKRGLNIYKRMLAELKSELGYNVDVSKEGVVIGSHVISNKEGKDIDDANTYNRTLSALADIAEATVRTGESAEASTISYEALVKKSGLTEIQFNQKTREIIDRHMDMLAGEYGGLKNIKFDPVGEGGKLNPMMEFFKQAKVIEASERVYNVVTGKFPSGDKLGDKTLTESLDKLFMIDGKYASSIDAYKNIIKDFVKDPKNEKEAQANEQVIEHLNDLRDLFELRKKVVGVSSKDPSGKVLTGEGISIAQNQWKNLNTQLPREWKQDWATHTRELYINRIFKAKGFDRRAINLVSMLADANIAIPNGEGKLTMPSRDAVMNELKSRNMSKKDIEAYEKAVDTIEKVLGEDAIVRTDFAFVENGKRQMNVVDIKDYIKAAKMLGNETFTDLIVNTQAVLGELASASKTGTRKLIKDIYDKTTDLIDTLDPSTNKKPIEDPIKTIDNLKNELKALENTARSEDTKQDISDAIIQIDSLIDAIDRQTGKFNITPKKNLTENEQISGDEFGVHEALTRPLQASLEKIYSKETESVNKLRELVVKIENLTALGKSGLGLDKSETMRIVENMSREWHKLYKNKEGDSVEVLSELINKVNQNGFFGDAINLLEQVDTRVNRAVILNNEHHILNADAVKMSESLEAGHKTHEHHRSVKEILKEYNLVNKDGDIDPTFRDALIENPYKALNENIRKQIFDQKDVSISQKQKEWSTFREKDALELLTNIFNSKPVNRIKIMGMTKDGKKRGIIEFNNNAPAISHPNNEYYSKKGYKIHFIDDTISIDVDGRLRNTSLDTIASPDKIQSFLNQALHVDKSRLEIIDSFKSIDPGISEADIKKILKNPTEYVFYLRLSPMDKAMFVATESNLKLLNSEFKTTYDSIESRLSGKDKDVFKAMFGGLLDASNSSRANVELKMLLPYLDNTGKRSEIEKLIKEYAGNANPEKLAKIQANMYKRGFLSDGGTTQPMNKNVLRWAQNHHPNKAIKEEATRIIKNGGFTIGVIGDGASEGSSGKKHPLNIENIEMGQLQVIGQAGGLLKELSLAQQKAAADQPSLLSSLLDGAKFASERTMKLIMAQKGMLDTDFTDSPNGAKTVIFATGDNQLLGKGYLIYHPDIAKQMPKDVDIALGETSAKTLHGTSIDGNPIKPFDLSQASGKWQNTIKNMDNSNKMLVPVESIGVSFTSKNETGVAISPSIFDFQSASNIKAATVWMGFENKLREVAVQWDSVHRDGAKLAEWLYEINKSEGNPMDRGDTGLTKLLFSYGAMPNNPLTQKALRRLLRSSNYKHLSKAPNQRGGEDNFIVPNIDGKLSVPLYAEIYKAAGDAIHDRATVNYGGIGLNSHTARRQLGNSITGVTSNLQGERFIYRDANGVDVVVSVEGGKFEYYSTFYDKSTNPLKHPGSNNYRYKGTDRAGNNAFRDAGGIKEDKSSRTKVEAQLQRLDKMVKAHNLTYHDAFRLLNGEIITKVDSNGITSTFDLKVDKALKMNFGSMSHAIPIIGHDKVIFRVEKIMEGMDGLTEVNVHDLRTVMQRDNDGDHLFTHTSMPWSIFKSFAKENGRKDDFRMWERSQVLNSDYINIFGIGMNGKAGEKATQVGFQNYAAKIYGAKMMTGQIIGARNAIAWLNRLGFKLKGNDLLKDFIRDEGMAADNWKVLDKFYDTVQNGLDIHGGIHNAISTQDKLRDFLYFGKKDIHTGETGDASFDKHNDPDLTFFGDNHKTFGNKRIEREIFYELLRTLKKSNMIQNDTWDERGSRSPEPFEIKSAYYDMRNLFANPTGYLAQKLARKIGRMQGAEKDALISEYAEMFYGKTMDFKRRDGRDNLYRDIVKGRQGSIMDNVFSLDPRQVSPDNPDQGFELSVGGKLMKELIGTNGFWDSNYGGLAKTGTDIYNKAGFFVKNIENFVETARLFGDNPLEAAKRLDLDMNVDSFSKEKAGSEIRNALNNGILRELIHRQHDNVFGSLEYFRAENFANPNKVDKLQQRLRNLQTAMDIMDQQIAKNMVIEKSDVQYINVKDGISFDQHRYLSKGKMLDIYRVRGDVQYIKPEGTSNLTNFSVDNKSLDYGQLEFVGRFDRNSAEKYLHKGYSYIVDRNPKQMKSQSSNEARYSDALFKATYGNDTSPELFIKDKGVINDFRDDVRRLRASISSDYSKTIENALSNRVLSEGLFAINSAKEGRSMAEFVDRWLPLVSGGDPMKLLLRYVLQPQVTPSYYYRDAKGHERPAYKTNEHLYKTVLQWAENNNARQFVQELIRDVEHYAAGKETEIDISSYERGSMDRFDYTELGDMANSYRTIAKHLNVFYSSPILIDKLNGVIDNRKSPIQTVRGKDGSLIPFREMPQKDDYWKYATDQTGEGC